MSFGRLGVLGSLGRLGGGAGRAGFIAGAVTDLRFDKQLYRAFAPGENGNFYIAAIEV